LRHSLELAASPADIPENGWDAIPEAPRPPTQDRAGAQVDAELAVQVIEPAAFC
jgi:hypothetical protein